MMNVKTIDASWSCGVNFYYDVYYDVNFYYDLKFVSMNTNARGQNQRLHTVFMHCIVTTVEVKEMISDGYCVIYMHLCYRPNKVRI